MSLSQIAEIVIWWVLFPAGSLVGGFFLLIILGKIISVVFSLRGKATCESKDCPNLCDDLILIKNDEKAFCRQHALAVFFDEIKPIKRFLFFKAYPKKIPTSSDAEIGNVRLNKDDFKSMSQYGLWGDDQNEQEAVFNRIFGHLKNFSGICRACSLNLARVGFYEFNELTYPDGVCFSKVMHPPKPICFECFAKEIQSAITNTNLYPGILFFPPSSQEGEYLFYFEDPKAR